MSIHVNSTNSNRATTTTGNRKSIEKKKKRRLEIMEAIKPISDRAEELRERGLGVGIHADDDDEWDEAIVCDDLGLLHRPCRPFLHALRRRSLLGDP
ncbi:unnamed protein product [Camellia sinensis]